MRAVFKSESSHLSSLKAMSLIVNTKEAILSLSWSTYEPMAVRFDFYLRMSSSLLLIRSQREERSEEWE